MLYVAMFLHDIAKGRPEDHSIAGAAARSACARGSAFRRPIPRPVAWLIEQHLVMSTRGAIARPVRSQDHRELRCGGAIGRTAEAAHHPHHGRHQGRRARRLERLEGPAQLRTLYYRNRTGADRRLLRGQPRPAYHRGPGGIPRRTFTEWPERRASNAYIARHYPAYWLKVDLPRKIYNARVRHAPAKEDGHKNSRSMSASTKTRGVTELTILRARSSLACCRLSPGPVRSAGANIVDAQIYTTTDGLALDTISISREYDRDEDEAAARRALARPSSRRSRVS